MANILAAREKGAVSNKRVNLPCIDTAFADCNVIMSEKTLIKPITTLFALDYYNYLETEILRILNSEITQKTRRGQSFTPLQGIIKLNMISCLISL